eukprot:8935190-Alexandrium_andersonii.AAC.1
MGSRDPNGLFGTADPKRCRAVCVGSTSAHEEPNVNGGAAAPLSAQCLYVWVGVAVLFCPFGSVAVP